MMIGVATDYDVEAWFDRNRDRVAAATESEIEAIAAWIPLIGLPANDRFAPASIRDVPTPLLHR